MTQKQPHPADIYAGRKMRERRKELKLSAQDLALSSGISYQQLCKYENAANRLSVSRLSQIAIILDVPVRYFFEERDMLPVATFIPGQKDLCRLYAQMENKQQYTLLEIAKVLADVGQG